MKKPIYSALILAAFLVLGGCGAGAIGSGEPNGNQESPDRMNPGSGEGSGTGMMGGMGGHMNHDNPIKLKDSTGENELKIPPALKPDSGDVTYTVEARKGKTEIFAGNPTETYGYNGSFLGPMLQVERGQNVKIKTVNGMDEPTTFHWHGLEIAGHGDGGPHSVLQPGEEKIIEFKVTQEAATLWFHPHPEGKTAEQVYSGLAGLLYISDKESESLSIPREYGVNDFPLIVQDRAFDENGQLDYSRAMNPDGTIGNTLLINGTVNPRLTVPGGKVRLRLLNGSNARNYTFRLSSGATFEQIATDGGLLNQPVPMKEVTLTPSERAEIVVDFSAMEKSPDLALMDDQGAVLLPFSVKQGDKETPSAEIPDTLNDYAVTEEELNKPVTKKLELFGMGRHVTINGRKFDMNRIDFTQKAGETEIWELYNKPDMMGGMIHPFHIHGTQFKILTINGELPPENERGWKDTIALKPDDRVKIAVNFKNKGIYMFHCHILEHEDNGMMGQIEIN